MIKQVVSWGECGNGLLASEQGDSCAGLILGARVYGCMEHGCGMAQQLQDSFVSFRHVISARAGRCLLLPLRSRRLRNAMLHF